MMQEAKTLLPALLEELDDIQALLTLRFVLYVLSRDDPSGLDDTLRALATFDLSHLMHLACLLDDDNRAELVFRAEELLRAHRTQGVQGGV